MKYVEDSTEFFGIVGAEVLSCIMFTNGLLQCNVMEKVLSELCKEQGINFYLSDVSNIRLGKAYSSFGVGALPKYIFVKEGSVVYSDFGSARKSDIETALQKRL